MPALQHAAKDTIYTYECMHACEQWDLLLWLQKKKREKPKSNHHQSHNYSISLLQSSIRLLKEMRQSSPTFAHEQLTALGFPFCHEQLENLTKYNGFHILDNCQGRTINSERRETNEMSPITALTYCLETLSRLQHKERKPKGLVKLK